MTIMGMTWEPDLSRRISEREWEVWGKVALGQSNESIASELGVSASTVENIISRLYLKLNIPNEGARRVKLCLIFPLKRT